MIHTSTASPALRFQPVTLPNGLNTLMALYAETHPDLTDLRPLLTEAGTSLVACVGEHAVPAWGARFILDWVTRRSLPGGPGPDALPNLDDLRRYLERQVEESRVIRADWQRTERRRQEQEQADEPNRLRLLEQLNGRPVRVSVCWKCGGPSRVLDGQLRFPDAARVWDDPRFTWTTEGGPDCGC